MPRFWKIVAEANRTPTLEELACAWLGVKSEEPTKAAPTDDDDWVKEVRERFRG